MLNVTWVPRGRGKVRPVLKITRDAWLEFIACAPITFMVKETECFLFPFSCEN